MKEYPEELHDAILGIIKSEVLNEFHSYTFKDRLAKIRKNIADKAGIDLRTEIRRDFDGCSSVDYLIDKMIAELLVDGRIRQ